MEFSHRRGRPRITKKKVRSSYAKQGEGRSVWPNREGGSRVVKDEEEVGMGGRGVLFW